ncbi:hypothetical protein LWI29_026147 [Acer saccharum]|uniref:HMA domain-containing protein n=1 Tax=Acer saccharum TaxID=4024 RepID=A0AA39S0U0_ACESA|nr:hypothetical protein LWI29_026147 [Acer saccharum]KAK1581710.1 hypothetical protein Q3G72_008290 [Acer saccharum]
MVATKDEKKKEADGVITGIYKVNLHCPQCANKIKKPLLRTQGVQSVEVHIEKSEVKVKGAIDAVKIHKSIEKLSNRKVELISPQIKINKETAATEIKKPAAKETKESIIRTTSVKVHLHCEKCEHDLRKKLLKHRGIHSVKTDMKAQTVTVQGTIESDKLQSYFRKNLHKHSEIITSKPDQKKEEKKEKEKEKVEAAISTPSTKIVEFKEEKKEKVEAAISTSSTKIVEFKEEVVEVKSKEINTPYFIHYVYAPQLFSDENPNACSIV